MEGEGS